MGFVIVLTLFIEAGVLLYLERKAWNTLLTPLNFLLIPYLVVLLVSMIMSGRSGFVEFYYPSIVIWIAGLVMFAIPSLAISGFAQKNDVKPFKTDISDERIPPLFVLVGMMLVLMFAYRLMSTVRSSEFIIGSDEFAEEFAGFGFWGHLKRFCSVMLMLFIYYLNRNQRWIWFFIIAFFTVNVINMVKGTMIIPCVVGVLMRLASGKMRIDARFLTILCLSAVGVFFLTFLLAIVVVNKMEVTDRIVLWIFQRFVHYFSSGTLGLSVDMQMGFPDSGEFQVIWTPFINILNQLNGSGEVLSPVNPTFHFTGISLTNVRTFFGTLYIYTNHLQFCLYSMGLSAFCYSLKVLSQRFDNLYTNTVYYYFCGLLAMGWFEFYFFHLDIIEIPVMLMLLHFADWAFLGRRYPAKLETA